jgi:NAD+ synthase (glutamine-hydrolysing)
MNKIKVDYEPSLYLWDYLKKSKATGYFLALSGGADSAAVALVVYNMCRLLHK